MRLRSGITRSVEPTVRIQIPSAVLTNDENSLWPRDEPGPLIIEWRIFRTALIAVLPTPGVNYGIDAERIKR
jgi:hypothetical protein